jgi:hypothetical protein
MSGVMRGSVQKKSQDEREEPDRGTIMSRQADTGLPFSQNVSMLCILLLVSSWQDNLK